MNITNRLIFAGAIALMSAGANAELIGHWAGDGNTNDSLGKNNGSLINQTTYADGRFNEAFLFDGDTDSVYLGTELDVSTEFTLSGWFNLFEYDNENQIFNNESAYEIAVRGDEVQVALMTTDNRWYWIKTGWKVELNEWTYFSMTYNGALINLYDEAGAERLSKAYSGTVLNGSEARIGARGSNSHSFNGMIDEISLFDVALTPQSLVLDEASADIVAVPVSASFSLMTLAMVGMRLRRK